MSRLDRDRRTGEDHPKCAVGFAPKPVWPGESQEAYDQLFDDLVWQYDPVGRIEENLVETIVDALWRKEHIDVFQRAFEARRKWGAYFKYPGDPEGVSRISRADQLAAMRVLSTTILATVIVQSELADTGGEDATGTTEDNSKTLEKALDVSKKGADGDETADSAASNNSLIAKIPEGLFKRVVRAALAEIEADCTSADGKAQDEFLVPVVSRIVELELAAEKSGARQPAIGEYEEIADRFSDSLASVDPAWGAAAVQGSMKKIHHDEAEHSLAQLGDLLTPECHSAELRYKDLLDLTIERAHDRLTKYQAARTKRAAANIVSLQPVWAARRR
jgi:hypothetical protein